MLPLSYSINITKGDKVFFSNKIKKTIRPMC